MRPSDENQHRSKRPNLFSGSSRPDSDDEHILARLERGASAPAAHQSARSTPMLLGGASLAIAALLGVLGVLVNDNAGPAAAIAMEVAVKPAPAVPERVATPQAAALIVDQFDHLADLAPSLVTQGVAAPVDQPVAPARSLAPRQAAKRPALVVKARPSAPKPEAPVDTDVAILTAILSQSPRYSPNKACIAGAGQPCERAPRP